MGVHRVPLFQGSLAGAAGLFADLMKASGANQRVFELIDRVPRVPPAFRPTPMEAEADDWAREWENHEVIKLRILLNATIRATMHIARHPR